MIFSDNEKTFSSEKKGERNWIKINYVQGFQTLTHQFWMSLRTQLAGVEFQRKYLLWKSSSRFLRWSKWATSNRASVSPQALLTTCCFAPSEPPRLFGLIECVHTFNPGPIRLNRADKNRQSVQFREVRRKRPFTLDFFFFFFILSLIGSVSLKLSRHVKVVCGLDCLVRGAMRLLIASVVFFSY